MRGEIEAARNWPDSSIPNRWRDCVRPQWRRSIPSYITISFMSSSSRSRLNSSTRVQCFQYGAHCQAWTSQEVRMLSLWSATTTCQGAAQPLPGGEEGDKHQTKQFVLPSARTPHYTVFRLHSRVRATIISFII